jgi:sugar phosphate isomerase/epimerase
MIVRHFGGDRLSYWHDMGHIQIRENLGFTNHLRTAQRLLPLMSGVHIHDVAPPAMDHLPPSKGSIDFSHFRFLANRDNLLVIEPGPGTPAPDIEAGIRYLREAWAAPSPAEQSPKTGGE